MCIFVCKEKLFTELSCDHLTTKMDQRTTIQIPLDQNLGNEPLNQYRTTAEVKAGINGLWKSSRKLCMQALAWQLLKNLEEKGIGTHEIEFESLKRSWQREVKKGYEKDLREYGRSMIHRRDQKYVKGLLRLRALQARSDWEQCKKTYRTEKMELKKAARRLGLENRLKRELKKMVCHYGQEYNRRKETHSKKIMNLEKTYAARKQEEQKQVEQRRLEQEDWIQRMVQGTGNSNQDIVRQVPIYGNLTFDHDETAALRLPPKFCTYSRIEQEAGRYERALCNTKLRWGRREKGSPEEQEAEAREDTEDVSPDEKMAQDIIENSGREVYDPGTKTLDFRKLRVTDMKDNPRVQLPQP